MAKKPSPTDTTESDANTADGGADTSVAASSVDAADAEVQGSQAALDDAAEFANAAVSAGDAGEGAKPAERPRLSREEHRALSRKIARRQRELGTAELERQYPNTIVVNTPLALGDYNIASSALRFLGLTDRTYYLLNRYGSRYMKGDELDRIKDSMNALVKNYADEAVQALEQGKDLVDRHQSESADPWLEPHYTSHTLDQSFGVKARQTMVIVQALHKWDQAILAFASLNFNGVGDDDQIDTLRRRERAMFMSINTMCIRTISAIGRRAKAMARESKPVSDSNDAQAASQEAVSA